MTNEDIRETLENRLKRVEILKKIDEIKLVRAKEEVETERKRFDLEQLKKKESVYPTPVDQLMAIARAYYIETDPKVGSEAAIKGLWDEEALNLIRSKIMKKVKEL